MTLVRHGALVGRNDRELLREVGALYDIDMDALRLAMLPPDERWHVEQHRAALARHAPDED